MPGACGVDAERKIGRGCANGSHSRRRAEQNRDERGYWKKYEESEHAVGKRL